MMCRFGLPRRHDAAQRGRVIVLTLASGSVVTFIFLRPTESISATITGFDILGTARAVDPKNGVRVAAWFWDKLPPLVAERTRGTEPGPRLDVHSQDQLFVAESSASAVTGKAVAGRHEDSMTAQTALLVTSLDRFAVARNASRVVGQLGPELREFARHSIPRTNPIRLPRRQPVGQFFRPFAVAISSEKC
jgi:hypothetical protein